MGPALVLAPGSHGGVDRADVVHRDPARVTPAGERVVGAFGDRARVANEERVGKPEAVEREALAVEALDGQCRIRVYCRRDE